jgi:hypothetical protein
MAEHLASLQARSNLHVSHAILPVRFVELHGGRDSLSTNNMRRKSIKSLDWTLIFSHRLDLMVNASNLKLQTTKWPFKETVRQCYLPRASAFVRCVKVSGNELMRAVTPTGFHHAAPGRSTISQQHGQDGCPLKRSLVSADGLRQSNDLMSPSEQFRLLPMPNPLVQVRSRPFFTADVISIFIIPCK